MLLYKDVISGDEMLSDSYDIKVRAQRCVPWRALPGAREGEYGASRCLKHVAVCARVQEGEIFFEVAGKWVVTGDVEVDIGANASAEEAAEELESSSKKVVDIVDAFRLQETSWDKKGFMGYIKTFMKTVADKLPAERKEAFMAAAPAAVKELLGRFDELQFFTGESSDLEGSLAYAYYKEGAVDPTFCYFKDALKEVRGGPRAIHRHALHARGAEHARVPLTTVARTSRTRRSSARRTA